MQIWRAPLDAMRFLLFETLDFEGRIRALPRFAELDRETVAAVLEEAARLAAERLLPLNARGDREGLRFEGGAVRMPSGFREAYRLFAAGGWCGLTIDPAYGGQGLPQVLQVAVSEMISAANMAFGITPGLSQGAAHALELWGRPEQKARLLPKLASGEWSGTMCLTEPQAGSDLGLIRTRAEPAGGDRFRISGTKIFISAGEHDLTDNILHLVLARLPDAPWGTRGISLFAVPKYRLAPGGGPAAQNGVRCTGIEEKMGLHASPTCTLVFEEAEGELVGPPHGGMKAMFSMMNAARLLVGVQGLGLAETACQSAVAHAGERLQGRAPAAAQRPDLPADPIIHHPDVREMLYAMRARIEPARALALEVGMMIDRAQHAPDPGARRAAEDFAALMTPVIKAHFTDFALEAALTAQQVHGGYGYIREQGIEQLVRDVRITTIYEGTNGIQALDLLGRKLPAGSGRMLRRFFHPLEDFLARHRDAPALGALLPALEKAFGRLQRASLELARRGLADPGEAAGVARDYLALFALVALGWMWARMLCALAARGEAAPPALRRSWPHLARYYHARVLPLSATLFARIMAGSGLLALEGVAPGARSR